MLFLYMLAYISSTSAVCPLYDITKSFEGNCKQGPALCHFIPQRSIPPRSEWYCLLGYPIASPIGIPACAIMTSKGIALAAQLGFDVLTYKTICSSKVTSYELPNICYVSYDQHITNNDVGKSFYVADTMQEQSTAIAISNSLGNPSADVEWVKQDIAQARAALYEGQVLIVSVFGQGTDLDSIAKDFAITAQMAYQAGAQIVELNLSCPNLERQ